MAGWGPQALRTSVGGATCEVGVEHEFGRAAEQPQEPFVMPTTVEEVEKLSWGELLLLAGENAEALDINGTAPKPARS